MTASLRVTYQVAPGLRLYSASLLAVYDADAPARAARVALIDFPHAYLDVVTEGGNPETEDLADNALKGLTSLWEMSRVLGRVVQ